MQASTLDIPAAEAAQITSLQLSRQGLERLPDDLHRRFPNLRQLHLNHNHLRSLPKRLFRLPQLSVLHLDHNRLTKIPDTIHEAAQLRQLSLRANRLRKLPALPSRLEVLDLAGNRFSELPPSLHQHIPLLHLDFADNRIHSLPPMMAYYWSSLQYLNLSGCGLSQLPELPPRLYALQLARNRLTSLPPGLAALQTLHRLDLSHNPCTLSLDALPAGLRYLDLRHTPTRWATPAQLLSALPQLTHAYGGLTTRNQQYLSDFLLESGERPSHIPLIEYWKLWRGKSVTHLSLDQLLAALRPSQPDRIAAVAHQQLCPREKLPASWLRQQYWTIIGQTGLPRDTLQTRLGHRGVSYTENLAQAQCIILGHSLDEAPDLQPEQTCVSERTLLRTLDPLQGRQLTGSASSSQEVLQLIRDLNGAPEAARDLALNSLRAFGTPDALLPSLLLQWNKLSQEGHHDIILPYLPPFFQRILVYGHKPLSPPTLRRNLDKKLWAMVEVNSELLSSVRGRASYLSA